MGRDIIPDACCVRLEEHVPDHFPGGQNIGADGGNGACLVADFQVDRLCPCHHVSGQIQIRTAGRDLVSDDLCIRV
mgnify:CR=1 FL=1